MKKKILVIMFCLLVLAGCTKKEETEYGKNSAALSFKETYETLNGTTKSGKENRTISIPENNPYITVDAKTIVEMIENKETFYVYFGFPACPWCRSVLEIATDEAIKAKVDKIYYVNVYDIRDTYVVENDKLVRKYDGTEAYNKLIKSLENVLDPYTVKDANGKEYDTKEKRIYAPNFVYIKDGKAEKLITGISERQNDSRMELTAEIKNDEKEEFQKFFK